MYFYNLLKPEVVLKVKIWPEVFLNDPVCCLCGVTVCVCSYLNVFQKYMYVVVLFVFTEKLPVRVKEVRNFGAKGIRKKFVMWRDIQVTVMLMTSLWWLFNDCDHFNMLATKKYVGDIFLNVGDNSIQGSAGRRRPCRPWTLNPWFPSLKPSWAS